MVMAFSRILDWDDSGWRDRAACRDSNPDLFFPVGSTGGALEEIQAAKAVCGTCPVREECLAFALETNQEAGIWGGASEEERRTLRRERLARRRAALVLR
jgi:WhiB family redox-sensing transcriptional regulator